MAYTLRQARRLMDKSQLSCAKAIGVCEHTYRKIEKKPSTATVQQAMALSRFLGVSYDDIIFAEDSN